MPKKSFPVSAVVWFGLGLLAATLISNSAWTRLPINTPILADEKSTVDASQPEYITSRQVREACAKLGIRDWTQLRQPDVQEAEAKAILAALRPAGVVLSVEEFRRGLQVELEHGQKFPEANITNNHPLATGMIVVAHVKEFPEYYQRLEVLEIEGDLLKTLQSAEKEELPGLFRKLSRAKLELAEAEARQLAK